MSVNLEEVRKEAARIQEDSLYVAKSHFNVSDRWLRVHFWLGIPAAILAALASASAFNEYGQLAGVLSILVTALTAVVTFLDPNAKATMHKAAGDRFLRLRNAARRFHDIELSGLSEHEAVAKIQELGQQKDDLNESSPLIPNWAFQKARKGIESGEAAYQVDQQGR
jgi:hypothetical protein